MKVSYNVIQKLSKTDQSVENIVQKLTMHVAEVEWIEEGWWVDLWSIFVAQIQSVKKHSDSEKLNLCQVLHNNEELQIVCWAPNVKAWIKVPLAVVWADLWNGFIIKKSKIRGETSNGMICSEDELGLVEERQEWIMILSDEAVLWTSMKEYIWWSDTIIEIDNKAINHRPDMFGHVWVAREIAAIEWRTFEYTYKDVDFTNHESLWIKVEIPKFVQRYIGVRVENVQNSESPEYIQDILKSENIKSQWLLVDLTNYSLYMLGQPTHCFDAETIEWNIVVRFAEKWESFEALNDKTYELDESDIVITDDSGVIALGGIIGWKKTSVSKTTKNIIIEWAHFHHATVRKTGMRLWIRTDALNIYEKNIEPRMAEAGVALIIDEIQKHFSNAKVIWTDDVRAIEFEEIFIDYDINFVNTLLWHTYTDEIARKILESLGFEFQQWKIKVPFWRTDVTTKADIAEEIARINGYNNIENQLIHIESWAVEQSKLYTLKRKSRDFWIGLGFYDIYSYSFTWKNLEQKVLWDINKKIPLKNYLSEDASHMKSSHIPHLLSTLQNNIHQFQKLKLFEIEKVYSKSNNETINETTMLSWICILESETPYFGLQKLINMYLESIWIQKYFYEAVQDTQGFMHKGRTAELKVRWKIVGYIWEIHPKIQWNFKIKNKIAFFELSLDNLVDASFSIPQAKELSEFQENNFDINFLVDKSVSGSVIHQTIEKTNPDIITRVELFDIYENEEKLPGKRSLSFTIYMQSLEKTLGDEVKNDLIKKIVEKVEKKWGILR